MKQLIFILVCCLIGCGLMVHGGPSMKLRRKVLRSRTLVTPKPVTDTETADQSLALADKGRAKRSHDKWLEIIAQFSRPGENGAANLPWQPFPLNLAVNGADGRPVSLPLLVLPVPVPVPGLNRECSANNEVTINPRIDVNKQNTVDLQTQEQNIDYLIQLFQEQIPRGPELPPAVVGTPPEIQRPRVTREYLPPVENAIPPTPVFNTSMMLRGFLTVYKSDFTESYVAWYNAKTGATRVDYHDEGDTSYQMVLPDGRVQRFVRNIDRTGEEDVRVCGVTEPYTPTGQDLAPPVLPDPREFTFDGYREEFGGRAEAWRRTVEGAEGAQGAARGERLTFRHELLVNRNARGFAIPLKYSVAIDSSVLGANCDGYEHMYSEVKLQEPNKNKFSFNKDRDCDVREKLDPKNAEDMARLDPLREYTLPGRDPRYDGIFDKFLSEYERTFANDKEAALRKALVIKNLRRVASCNRQSLSFQSAANYLLDRLDVEIQVTFGIDLSLAENDNIQFEPFPYSPETAGDLEDEFDWRKLGGVTPVKNQGSCSSCWAHSVIGSVEGGRFRATGQLQELSEQALVDCGHSHGTKGCNGSWPSNAFNYIKDKGIPARDAYTPYQAKVLECRENEVEKAARIRGFSKIPPNNIKAMKLAIRKEAPVVVIVDTDNLMAQFMARGVYHDERPQYTRKPRLAHAELAVGWGKHRGDTYFILKNSYGPKYAENGFIRVHAPSNTMYFLAMPSVALV